MNFTASGKRTLESGEQFILVTATNKPISTAQTIKLFMDKFVRIKKSTETSNLFYVENLVVAPSSQETAFSFPLPCILTGSISDTSADSPENFMLTVDLEQTALIDKDYMYTAINTAFRAMQRQDSQTIYDIDSTSVTVTNISVSIK